MIALVKVKRKSTEETTEGKKKEVRYSANLDILKAAFTANKEEEKPDRLSDKDLDEKIEG